MTNDDIQQLLDETRLVAVQEMFEAELFAFARAIATKERDACAKVCESMRPSKPEFDQRFYTACTLCANAIRARGE